MANYAETVLLEARYLLNQDAEKKFTQRGNLTNIHKAYIEGAEYVSGEKGESLEKLRTATTRATKIKYLKKQTFTATTSKSCNPDGDFGDTGNVTATWASLVRTIKLREKTFLGNEVSAIKALSNSVYQMELDILLGSANSLNAAMLAHLEANRTQVNALSTAGVSKNTWYGTPNFYVSTAAANIGRFYNFLMADMAANNYNGDFYDIHDTFWGAEVANYAAQGTANSTNTAYQFDGFERLSSNLIVPTGYNSSLHYVVPKGGVASLTWNDGLNLSNAEIQGGGMYRVQESMLVPGLYYDVFIKEACADTTSYGGGTQDKVTDIEFTLNYSLLKQPLDTANETPIFKYYVATT